MQNNRCTEIYGIFEENSSIYLLMEYFEERDFLMRIRSVPSISLREGLEYIEDISLAVESLHKNNILL